MKEICPLKENCNTATTIVGVCMIGAALLGTYYFIKKKREESKKTEIRASFV